MRTANNNSPKLFVVSLLALAALNLTVHASEGGMGNGGDTYVAQMDESRLLALDVWATADLSRLPAAPRAHLDRYGAKWKAALAAAKFERSNEVLRDVDGDNRPKAALANRATGTVQISLPYWEKHPVTFLQSFVLTFHESGHLADLPLTHDELENVGLAVAKLSWLDQLGADGLAKIQEGDPKLGPYAQLELLYRAAPEPFALRALEELSAFYQSPVGPWNNHRCAGFTRPARPNLTARLKEMNFSSRPASPGFEGPDDGPLFPRRRNAFHIFPVFRGNLSLQGPIEIEPTLRELGVTGTFDLATNDRSAPVMKKVRMQFRRSAELVVFRMALVNSSDGSNFLYGYCWQVPPSNAP